MAVTRWIRFGVALLIVTLLIVTGLVAAGAARAQDTIKMGVLLPFTGPLA